MTDHTDLLARLERYYDDAPRVGADTEEHGPFTVFVSRGGWPYYARPRLGHTGEITADDVSSVLDRLEELGVPRSIEWVHDTTPSLRAAAVTLRLHHSTLQDRVIQAEHLLGWPVREPAGRLRLQLALALRRLRRHPDG